jgi:peroxiredoxin
MRAFQEDLSKFESPNTQVLGVSTDDIETHKRFSAGLGLKFPLISDIDRKLSLLSLSNQTAAFLKTLEIFLPDRFFLIFSTPSRGYIK